MNDVMSTNFTDHFENLSDPRIETANKRHELMDILLLSVLAVICGADSFVDIERFGKAKEAFLRKVMNLPNGIPSHDTIGNVLSMLDPKQLQSGFISWVQSFNKLSSSDIVAIDGKTLRRSFTSGDKKGAIHMVSAFRAANHTVLGQIKVDEKSNEITAIPELIKLLNLEGSIVTIDAMGCQKVIAKAIRQAQADYVLSLKGNHGNLLYDVSRHLDALIDEGFKRAQSDHFETVEKGHGRIETKRYWITNDIDWLSCKEDWEGLKTIGVVESERTVISTGEASIERRYFICSIESSAALLAKAVRSHWAIENNLHWTLDVIFKEDESRIREGFAAENMAVIRHLALNMLKMESSKESVRGKRLKAGWDENFLLSVLSTAL